MRVITSRFELIIRLFPYLPVIMSKMDNANIPYRIGGSVALYLQGNQREPHDLDIMLTTEAHDRLDRLLGIESTLIERPNVKMRKSALYDVDSLDFLSSYTVIAEGKSYSSPPKEKTSLTLDGKDIQLVPAEKIIAFKLIGRRSHHQDIEDFKSIISKEDFDSSLFWEVVDNLEARELVDRLLHESLTDIELRKF
jgi:hypothetical protein